MKAPQFYISVGLGLLCLVLSVASVVLGQANGTLQTELNRQQEEINQGNASKQALDNILRDLANLSVNNEKVKELLQRHGFTVNQAPNTSSPSAQ